MKVMIMYFASDFKCMKRMFELFKETNTCAITPHYTCMTF